MLAIKNRKIYDGRIAPFELRVSLHDYRIVLYSGPAEYSALDERRVHGKDVKRREDEGGRIERARLR